MHTVEDLGLLKMDMLGLKNLTIIENTIRLIKDIQNVELRIDTIPLDDPNTFAMLQAGDTTGVFQLESSGMRRYLKDLRPNELEDIIAMVALYRPGPMELIPQYIARKFGREPVVYLHPMLEPILKNTYGIGVYQEQMMRIARDLAGFSLAQADTLRKAIGKKIKNLLDQQQEKLIAGMIKNGIDKKTARAIWELFPPFARYGFNRSHAVCYAYIAYQTAYLRAHFPIEFMASLLNADANDIDRISFLIGEAKRKHIAILPPDVNQSYRDFAPEGNNVRFGLGAVKNVGSNIVDAIVAERQKGGAYTTFEDFLTRVFHKDLNKKSLESLIKAGAFDSLGVERKMLLVNIDKIVLFAQEMRRAIASQQHNLFGGATAHTSLSLSPSQPATREEKLFWEKELLGFYMSDHPLKKYAAVFKQKQVSPLADIIARRAKGDIGGSLRAGGVVTSVKKIITKNNKPIVFAKLEDVSDTMEVVVFSETLERKPELWQEKNILIVQGKLSERDNEPKIIVDQAIKLN
jgi:DNA polymerase-3 subunit alpha